MTERNSPEEAGTLGALLRLAYEALAVRVYGRLAEHGFPEIRRAHGALLRHIAPGGSRLTDLAERAGMAKQSMAYLVQDMTELGHVMARPDPQDGRARLVRLTTRGRRLMATLLALSAEAEAEFAGRIGTEEMRGLRRSLEKFVARLEA